MEAGRRFKGAPTDPLRQWKLSDGSGSLRAGTITQSARSMLEATDSKHSPWYILRSDDKSGRA
jgi:polyphosphate kinase 2 (PPK2 family)